MDFPCVTKKKKVNQLVEGDQIGEATPEKTGWAIGLTSIVFHASKRGQGKPKVKTREVGLVSLVKWPTKVWSSPCGPRVVSCRRHGETTHGGAGPGPWVSPVPAAVSAPLDACGVERPTREVEPRSPKNSSAGVFWCPGALKPARRGERGCCLGCGAGSSEDWAIEEVILFVPSKRMTSSMERSEAHRAGPRLGVLVMVGHLHPVVVPAMPLLARGGGGRWRPGGTVKASSRSAVAFAMPLSEWDSGSGNRTPGDRCPCPYVVCPEEDPLSCGAVLGVVRLTGLRATRWDWQQPLRGGTGSGPACLGLRIWGGKRAWPLLRP
ncbi:hypothetical protein EAI_14174 [Harpegnathos saltator]|uniref:Uncharacterized protein n=1 Tax=Harpegnathos saltator TaxID=610380 RepID=E2B5K1_HARSA|nr:hypothetical protein EAI_14174 [Harpegnathos saltator]